MSSRGISGNLLTNLIDLSSDMKFLLQSNLMTDVTLCVNSKYLIHCHKDILKFRSKWFFTVFLEADSKGTNLIEVSEDIHVMKAVLCYIYTGNLETIESLNIPLVIFHEAAEKYGFSRLKKILERLMKDTEMNEVTKSLEFLWEINLDGCDSLDVDCHSLEGFTTYGKDKWRMKVKSSDVSDDIGIYISRQTEGPCTTIHTVRILISVIDYQGKEIFSFFDRHKIIDDGEYLLNKNIRLTDLEEEGTLLSKKVLTLSCALSVFAKTGYLTPFHLKDCYRWYIPNELVQLSDDMYDVFLSGDTHDFKFCQDLVKIHSYILIVRSNIPPVYINELERRVNFGRLSWTSFVIFLYTGQTRYLEDHGRGIYMALFETPFTMAKEKYSKFLSKNLTLENAFYVLCDAVSCKDDNLITAAADFLASKSNILSDAHMWIRIASNKTNFTNFLLEHFPQMYTMKQFL